MFQRGSRNTCADPFENMLLCNFYEKFENRIAYVKSGMDAIGYYRLSIFASFLFRFSICLFNSSFSDESYFSVQAYYCCIHLGLLIDFTVDFFCEMAYDNDS